MIVLALDTCDPRGSVALLRDDVLLASANHDSDEEYSSWLLLAIGDVLKRAGCSMADVGAYGVSSGPGSFTGVRVGLTTVKAWGEVYSKPIAAVSRLEAIARGAQPRTNYVAAFADARRGHLYGGVYQRKASALERSSDDLDIAPGKFVQTAVEFAAGEKIAWVSTGTSDLHETPEWRERRNLGETIETISPFLAATMARMAAIQIAAGRATGALELDANYVRRSDAEVLWNDARGSGR